MIVPISSIPPNGKFKHEGNTYTVYQHERTMVEVFGKGRFWAFPTWTGKELLKVEMISYRHERVNA